MHYEYEDEPRVQLDRKRLMVEMTLAILGLATLPPLVHYTFASVLN